MEVKVFCCCIYAKYAKIECETYRKQRELLCSAEKIRKLLVQVFKKLGMESEQTGLYRFSKNLKNRFTLVKANVQKMLWTVQREKIYQVEAQCMHVVVISPQKWQKKRLVMDSLSLQRVVLRRHLQAHIVHCRTDCASLHWTQTTTGSCSLFHALQNYRGR